MSPLFPTSTLRAYCLVFALSLAAIPSQSIAVEAPAEITLGDLTHVYDSTAKSPRVTTDPANLSYDLEFFHPQPVFDNFPPRLPLSFQSLAFSAQKTWGLGDYLELAPGARNLTSIDTALVTWAKAADYPAEAAVNPDGWYHPVTATIYSMGAGGILTFVGESTVDAFIPWRPVFLPDGTDYPFYGFAFRVRVPFPEGIVLPDAPVVLISYSTQNSGFSPIGSPGPYNELNMALVGNPPSVGADQDAAAVLWVRENAWNYPTPGTPGPLIQINVSGSPSSVAPIDAGDYQVRATINETGFTPLSKTEEFVILPAPVVLDFADLVQVADGSRKGIPAPTGPSGAPFEVLYNGSTRAPSAVGLYTVTVRSTDPNYASSQSETMVLGYEFPTWMGPKVAAGKIPSELAGPNDDPDGDGIVNRMEYALGLDPSSPSASASDQGLPFATPEGGGFSLVYRRHLFATELQFDVFTTTTPENPDSWVPVTTSDTVISTVDGVQVIRAAIPGGLAGPRGFVRLGVQ